MILFAIGTTTIVVVALFVVTWRPDFWSIKRHRNL